MAEVSSTHSFLLLKDKPPYPKGSLVEWRGGSYWGHTHLWYVSLESVNFSADEVAPLTEDECVLLDAIGNHANADNDCYTVYNTPGKLAWGLGLRVGDEVFARLPRSFLHVSSDGPQECLAVVRSVTPVKDPYGERRLFGVEIKVGACMVKSLDITS